MRMICTLLVLAGLLLQPAAVLAEFHIYDNDTGEFVGILVDNAYDYDSNKGYDEQEWVVYEPRHGNYFIYTIITMGSYASLKKGALWYTTENCSGTAYVSFDMFNSVRKLTSAELYYKGRDRRYYMTFRSKNEGAGCVDIDNNVMHFREAVQVPASEVPFGWKSDLQWRLEYKRTGGAVIPLNP